MRFSLGRVQHKQIEATFVFDIGSGSVGAGIVLTEQGKTSRIVAARRITLSLEDRDEKQRIAAISVALKKVGKVVLDSYIASPLFKEYGTPKGVYATLHAPWARSETNESTLALSGPTRITKEMIARVGKQAGDTKEAVPTGFRQFEHMVMRVELNGYPTGEPIGKVATSIRVVVLESSVVSGLYDAVEGAVHTLLPQSVIEAHSAVFVYGRVIRELAGRLTNYTFLDMTSEASTCMVIHNGTIAELGVVPAGFRTLLRAAAASGKMSAHETLTMLHMIEKGECTEPACVRAAQAVSDAEPEYMRAFGEVFSSLLKQGRLPNTLFIAVHPKIAPWTKRFFGRIDFSQFTLTGKPFAVEIISSRALARTVVYAGEAHPDSGVGVSAALVHIERSS